MFVLDHDVGQGRDVHMVEKLKKLWVPIWAVIEPYWFVIALGLAGAVIVTVAIVAISWTFHQTDSKQEQKADDARVATVKSDAEANQAVKSVEESTKTVETTKKSEKTVQEREKRAHSYAKNTQETVDKAKTDLDNAANKPSVDYNGSDAGKRFCGRFPSDPSCPSNR